MADPVSLEEAQRLVAAAASPTPAEAVPIAAAHGRTLAAPVVAGHDVQPFDNSAMDGFAVRAGSGPRLQLVDESRAGRPATLPVGAGEAIRISTGAAIPEEADAVVRLEDTEETGEEVILRVEPAEGANIRRAGEDVRIGQSVLGPGTRLGAAEIAVAAACGADSLGCRRSPRVGIVTTGDELRPPGTPLGPGEVHESNALAVSALCSAAGAEPAGVRHAVDDGEGIRAAVTAGLEGADMLIACGGISAGEHDHVRSAFLDAGVEEVFWGVALKPGRPAWFGLRDRTLVLGLPGNPVSAIVTFELIARRGIDAMLGRDPGHRDTHARLTAPYGKRQGRAEAVRCSLQLDEAGWRATPAPAQGSHVLSSMLDAHGLAILDPDVAELAAGSRVRVVLREEALL